VVKVLPAEFFCNRQRFSFNRGVQPHQDLAWLRRVGSFDGPVAAQPGGWQAAGWSEEFGDAT
jgi:hypothetical protein